MSFKSFDMTTQSLPFMEPTGDSSDPPNLNVTYTEKDKEYADPPNKMTELNKSDLFLRWEYLDPIAFAQLWPYSFVIWDSSATDDKKIIAEFPLPIPPQRITIDTPVASAITATMKGMVEDQNGAPFRRITISGTSGVNWERPINPTKGESPTIKDAIKDNLAYAFKDTIAAVKGAAGTLASTLNAFAGGESGVPANPPLNNQIEAGTGPTSDLKEGVDKLKNFAAGKGLTGTSIAGENDTLPALLNTGYLFFHNMARFFDHYIALKKTRKGNPIRLTFQMHKDKMYYDCILNNFNFVKPPGSVEYLYSAQLTAYRRRAKPVREYDEQPKNPTLAIAELPMLAKILNGLMAVTKNIKSVGNILKGVQNDYYSTIVKPLNEAILIFSSLMGLGKTVSDFANWLSGLADKPLVEGYKTPDDGKNWKDQIYIPKGPDDEFGVSDASVDTLELPAEIEKAFGEYVDSLESKTKEEWKAQLKEMLIFFILAEYALGAISLGYDAAGNPITPQSLAEANKMGLTTTTNPDGTITITITEEVEDDEGSPLITEKTVKKPSPLIDPFGAGSNMEMVNALLVGAFDSEEVETEGFDEGTGVAGATPEAIATLGVLNEAALLLGFVIATYDELKAQKEKADYAKYYNAYMTTYNIPTAADVSCYFVPVPLNSTMEQISQQYLGNPELWHSIASLNGLTPPYIDEQGFLKPLIATGSGHIVSVQSGEYLSVGQIVTLYSKEQSKEKRKIEKVETLDVTETLLTLDGEPDLAKFKKEDAAMLHAYLPSTINSKMMIAIPSDDSVSPLGPFKPFPGADDLSLVNQIAQVDWLLNAEGDLVLQGGDVMLSVGLQNIIQAGILKLQTPRGSLLNNPNFGNPLYAGLAVSDLDSSRLLAELGAMFQSDYRFGGVRAARLNLRGGTATLDIAVDVRGSGFYLPFMTKVPV